MAEKIKVLVVDDSELIRQILSGIINSSSDMTVVGVAVDPYDAREKIKQLAPDVLTLDIEMPKMDGISFLRNLMRLRPMPVVMISTLTEKGAPATLEALEIGAVDYLPKPKVDQANGLNEYAFEIIEKVRTAARANLQLHDTLINRREPKPSATNVYSPGRFIAIGASTGGTEAIKEVLQVMPANCPPIVIAQHIPPLFSTTFADRMNRTCLIQVREAQTGMKLESGNAYLAPGDFHLRVNRRGVDYYCELTQTEPVNRHRPSVEVLFDSAREAGGAKCVAAILTGMGSDGAEALLRLRGEGCHTVAQDQETSVVWGMPGVAVKLGAAEAILPLHRVAKFLLDKCSTKK
ncbi:MAG: chemotaxis response regulator protein-glutamate methylesterase [Hahellaceae bacterium]|nr:chemotaxis response regulator protein-glutamate methylesterase [Hahellaceae bacterium]MCP5213258.1 chemotaxis response regulator protein-glutamate methylesterase [Hahellaceae bacterium]